MAPHNLGGPEELLSRPNLPAPQLSLALVADGEQGTHQPGTEATDEPNDDS
jgi:hypothetical protein